VRNPEPHAASAPRTRKRAGSIAPPPAADLHVHTTHSDGVCSPCEVVVAAVCVGLTALAITDHDTLSAIAVARPEAARLGLELVGGVELTAEMEGREVHILGHFIGDDDPDLLAATDDLRARRAERLRAMAGRLEQLGLSIDLRALTRAFPRATLGRRHLADWLVRTGQVAGHREAFARYLADDGPAHVTKPRLTAALAIALVRGAGGVAGLAHPPYDLRESSLAALADLGLGSLEVAGHAIDARRGRRLRDWADRHDLVPIAGSDFHAADRPGRWLGSITTPGPDLERLRRKAAGRTAERPGAPLLLDTSEAVDRLPSELAR
jgi:3',5'-nucleoside bisphosphate phosphatase